MKRPCWTILVAGLVGACAQAPPDVQVVNDAAEALGGRDRILAVSTLIMEGGGTDGAVGGSVTPDAPPNTFKVTDNRKTFDLAHGRMHLQQVRTAQFAFANAVVTRQNQSLDGDIAFGVGQNGKIQTHAEVLQTLASKPKGPTTTE